MASLDVGELAPDRITGGTQDNGCIRSWSGQNPGSSDWFGFPGGGCGDGEYTLIDPSNPNIFYGCSQYANRGTTWTRISPPEVDLTGSFEPGRYTANINGPYPN